MAGVLRTSDDARQTARGRLIGAMAHGIQSRVEEAALVRRRWLERRVVALVTHVCQYEETRETIIGDQIIRIKRLESAHCRACIACVIVRDDEGPGRTIVGEWSIRKRRIRQRRRSELR